MNVMERIRDALGTAAEGEALVERARSAHRAEQQYAALLEWLAKKAAEEGEDYFTRHIDFTRYLRGGT